MKRDTKPYVGGLERFGLNAQSFRRLGGRKVHAYLHLGTYDVTPAVRRLQPSKRLAYLSERVERWIERLRRLYPELVFRVLGAKVGRISIKPSRKLLPGTLEVQCSARLLLKIAGTAGVRSVYIAKINGFRSRRSPRSPLEWYCVRALVVIRVERATSGQQSIEDRFVLVRASSFEDAKRRLRREWKEYAAPYLNSDGCMVSWELDRVTDVYETGETEINPAGTEVYSKLSGRRMRPEYIWRPGPRR